MLGEKPDFLYIILNGECLSLIPNQKEKEEIEERKLDIISRELYKQ